MSMKRFLFLFLLPVVGFSQNTLSVQVNNVKSHKGKVNVAVYDSDEGFLSFDQVLKFSFGMPSQLVSNFPLSFSSWKTAKAYSPEGRSM